MILSSFSASIDLQRIKLCSGHAWRASFLRLQGLWYIPRTVEQADYINGVFMLKVEQQVFLEALDLDHSHTEYKGYISVAS